MARVKDQSTQRASRSARNTRAPSGEYGTGPLAALQRMADAATAGGPFQRAEVDEEEPIQGKLQRVEEEEEPLQGMALQREEQGSNRTGMPDALKSGVEHLSGHSMDDVRVHFDSAEPAAVQAHAFARGNDIHLAPGQERHLPHEAWHVVQQAQGRVPVTTEVAGQPVNDDASLEREADVMGQKALSTQQN